MPRVVLDTSVVVAASRSRVGASSRLLELLAEGRFSAVLSTALLLEYEEALGREIRPKGWSETDVSEFVDSICSVMDHCAAPFRVRPLLRDPDDDFIVEIALAAAVDYVVTHNVKDFQGSESVGVRVVTPREFLQMLRDQS